MPKWTKAIFSQWSNWHFMGTRGLGWPKAGKFIFQRSWGWLLVIRCWKISQGWSRPQSEMPVGRVQIIPLIQSWQPGWWVNVVVLMQMVMITVSSYRGQLWETGGMGHGWLRIFWVLAQKSTFCYLSHTRKSGEIGVLPSFGLGSDVLTHKKFLKYVNVCIQ